MTDILETLWQMAYVICIRPFAQAGRNRIAVITLVQQMDSFINQAIASWIFKWTFKDTFSAFKPLNAFFNEIHAANQSNFSTESELKRLQRASKKLHDYNNQYRQNQLNQGISAPSPFILQNKHKGIPISKPNMHIIKNHTSDSPVSVFLSKLYTGQMSNIDSVSNVEFIDLFKDYENWYRTLLLYSSDEEYLINSADFFSLQTKTKIDLICELATYMDQNRFREYPCNTAPLFWHTLKIDDCILEANQVLTYNKAIPIVFSDDKKGIEASTEIWLLCRVSQARFIAYLDEVVGYDGLTIERAASFLKEHYDVLHHHAVPDFGTNVVPNAKRIRAARTIMKSLYDKKNFQQQECAT